MVTTRCSCPLCRYLSQHAGGLLNLKLRDRGANSWRGAIDIRKFALVDESKLRSMVSTPSGADGRSLNEAVKRDIDVSTARFERGYAELLYDQGALRVESGVVRGVGCRRDLPGHGA